MAAAGEAAQHRLPARGKDDVRRLDATVHEADRVQIIDQGDIPAYRFGRVIRLKAQEVDSFIDSCRIEPGTLEHLYPEPVDTSGT